MKRSYIAAGFVLAAAIYEALAVWTNQFRTITELVEDAPSVVELVVVGGLLVWILDHFGWLDWLPWRRRRDEQELPAIETPGINVVVSPYVPSDKVFVVNNAVLADILKGSVLDADPPPSPTRPDPGLSER